MILVTGSAGFIGAHVVQRLLIRGEPVVGIDDHNGYYDPELKAARLQALTARPGYTHLRGDIADRAFIEAAFERFRPQRVVHLAAQAGVRYSLQQPHAYAHANLSGFVNVIEAARRQQVAHFIYASSSSVYGSMSGQPMSEDAACAQPLSLYAATKRANELIAHSYAHLYGLPCTGLRFFTVYGPWGRPDMAPMLFAQAILEGRPISLFNRGRQTRSFTYIDDITDALVALLERPPSAARELPHGGQADSGPPWQLLNIGNPQPTPLLDFVACLEQALGRKAEIRLAAAAAGDVAETAADVQRLEAIIGRRAFVPLPVGLQTLARWLQAWRAGKATATRSALASAPPGALVA